MTVTNTGSQVITIDRIEAEGVGHLMAISQKSFTLLPGRSKEILIDIFAKEDEAPDAYIGRILIEGGGITKVINVIIEVKGKAPLFDVTTKLAKIELIPGENVVADITVINMGDLSNIDILLYYAIKDFDGNVIAFREESLAIKGELTITRQLNIPRDTKFGTYVFYARATYKEIIAASSETFNVGEIALTPPFLKKSSIAYFIIIAILMLIIIILLVRRRKEKKEEAVQTVYVGG